MNEQKKEEFLKKLNSEKEHCVICGAETPYKKTDDVLKRKYYVEGSGQLCERCYFLIYYGYGEKRRRKE
ncbi:MAG: hypothetical protein ACPLKV_03080 [Minisyncoccia bacterium]